MQLSDVLLSLAACLNMEYFQYLGIPLMNKQNNEICSHLFDSSCSLPPFVPPSMHPPPPCVVSDSQPLAEDELCHPQNCEGVGSLQYLLTHIFSGEEDNYFGLKIFQILELEQTKFIFCEWSTYFSKVDKFANFFFFGDA